MRLAAGGVSEGLLSEVLEQQPLGQDDIYCHRPSCCCWQVYKASSKEEAVEFDAGATGDAGKVTVMDSVGSSSGRPCRTRCRVTVRRTTTAKAELQVRAHSRR